MSRKIRTGPTITCTKLRSVKLSGGEPTPSSGDRRPVYRDFDLDSVLSEYQPVLHIASLDVIMDDWNERSAEARARIPMRRISYGTHPDEWLWYAPGPTTGRPLLAFLHGGYWRRLSADHGLVLAGAARDAGYAFASINYTLCPNGPLSLLIDQSRRATSHLIDAADELGHGAMHLAGHSAGAHLAACTAVAEHRLAGLIVVSGIFDIRPIVLTPINDDVRMTDEQAAAWSPAGRCPSIPSANCIVTWGDQETSEFARQGTEWAAEWSGVPGNRTALVQVAARRHHFDVIDDLLTPGTTLGDLVLASLDHTS